MTLCRMAGLLHFHAETQFAGLLVDGVEAAGSRGEKNHAVGNDGIKNLGVGFDRVENARVGRRDLVVIAGEKNIPR